MKRSEIIEMLKRFGVIVVEEEEALYIIMSELDCGEVEEVVESLIKKSDRYIKEEWAERFFFGDCEVIADYE